MADYTNGRYRYLAFKGSSYRRYLQGEKDRELAQDLLEIKINSTPAHGTYGNLLFDPQWKEKRKIILRRDAYCCVVCGGRNDLQVHHRQYHFVVSVNQFKLPWEYEDHLLITLCETCHKKGHNKYKVPTINI